LNTLLLTDVYKLGHMEQYPEGTEYTYSYLQARTAKELPKTVFFGLQYYLEEYLSKPITHADADEFLAVRESVLGPTPEGVKTRIRDLADLGFWPLSIKAVPEGEVMPVQNVLMTITNTIPGFGWCVGYVESLLLKVWNTTTVASYSLKLRELVTSYALRTCDNMAHLPFQVHDFGYRGVSSEETAGLSGAAHLLNFYGSDTVPAVPFLMKYYDATWPIALSVPATEHSVMCSYTKSGELKAFERMLELYPSGIVSIVSDTYDLWNVLTNYARSLRLRIKERDGKVVFRPDSGDPVKIICGDPAAPVGSPAYKGALELLGDTFGTTVNEKGYNVLDPHVGLIYGDGFFFNRFDEVLKRMQDQGWASSNLVVGIGGLLLQAHSRDELGFAIKATEGIINGKRVELFKDPVTDKKKRSHMGLLKLHKYGRGAYFTADHQSPEAEASADNYLVHVFKDGEVLRRYSLDEVRQRIVDTNDTVIIPLSLG